MVSLNPLGSFDGGRSALWGVHNLPGGVYLSSSVKLARRVSSLQRYNIQYQIQRTRRFQVVLILDKKCQKSWRHAKSIFSQSFQTLIPNIHRTKTRKTALRVIRYISEAGKRLTSRGFFKIPKHLKRKTKNIQDVLWLKTFSALLFDGS